MSDCPAPLAATRGDAHPSPARAEFSHTEVLPLRPDDTEYRQLTVDGIGTADAAGQTFLQVDPEVLTFLASEAIRDISHLLRPSHLAQLRAIVDDPEASANDRFVAMDLLRNACVSVECCRCARTPAPRS